MTSQYKEVDCLSFLGLIFLNRGTISPGMWSFQLNFNSFITGRRGNINLGAGAVLPDPIPAEGGSPLYQRLKPGTASTDGRACCGEDTVWRHALRHPIAGEGWGGRGGLHCCCCNHLNHRTRKEKLTKTGNKYFNNQSRYSIPNPQPLPHYIPTLSQRRCQTFRRKRGTWVYTNWSPRSQVSAGNVEHYVMNTWKERLLKQAVWGWDGYAMSWDQSDQRTRTKSWAAANEQMWNNQKKKLKVEQAEGRKGRVRNPVQYTKHLGQTEFANHSEWSVQAVRPFR